MQERGVQVDHSSISRWAIRFLPLLEKVFRRHKRPVGESWRMDETYIKVNGQWKYLYRAVDKAGKTVDFLLTARRDKKAAMRFFEKAMRANEVPEKVTMDKIGANKAAIDHIIENNQRESSNARSQLGGIESIPHCPRLSQTCRSRCAASFATCWTSGCFTISIITIGSMNATVI